MTESEEPAADMTASPFRRSALVLGFTAAAALLLAGCATSAAPTSPSASAPAVTSTPAPSAPEEADTGSQELGCEEILTPGILSTFESLGWESHAQGFTIGSLELSTGVWCKWGDPNGITSNTQVYGLAAITAEDAESAQRELVQQGWKQEDAPDGGIYVTEDPDTAFAPDEDGYGMTFLFGDGWVKVSDTRQGLILIATPS